MASLLEEMDALPEWYKAHGLTIVRRMREAETEEEKDAISLEFRAYADLRNDPQTMAVIGELMETTDFINGLTKFLRSIPTPSAEEDS